LTSAAVPLLRVEALGPEDVTLNEEASFEIRVANQSEVEATAVTVRIEIPNTVRVVSAQAGAGSATMEGDGPGNATIVWRLDRLPGRAAQPLDLRLVPLSNQPFDLAVNCAIEPLTSAARIDVKQPLLEIAVTGPSEVIFGDTKVYSIVLSNPGTGDAKNVSIDVNMGPDTSDSLQVGTVAAGTSKTFDIEVTARQPGKMQIAAAASGDNGLRSEAVQEILVQRAELQLAAAGPALQFAGTVGTYQVRIANTGNATAQGVHAVVRLPQGVRYVRGLDNARQEADSLIWQVGDLTPGADRTYGFDCELASDGEMLLRFAARSDGGLVASRDVLTRVEAIADLKLTVNDPKGPIPVGNDVTYEINIINRGTKAATQVDVVAQFSDGIEPVATDGTTAEILPGQVIFKPISRINPGETVKLTVKARAEADGNHVFRAAVKCTDPETRLVAEDTTRYYGGDALKRAADPSLGPATGQDAFAPRIGTKPSRSGGGWQP
jgi:uncharacterized repeat protein (TIGR01451 family)